MFKFAVMDFRLRVFVEVAYHLSFTKAARNLSISQPAITKHIQELENMFGVPLFERSAGKISLTRYGEMFLKHANEIVAGYRELMEDMELVSHRIEGVLKLGVEKSAQRCLLLVLADFTDKFPDVAVELFIGNAAQVEDALGEGRIELAVIGNDAANLSFKTRNDLPDLKTEIFGKFVRASLLKNQRRAGCTL